MRVMERERKREKGRKGEMGDGADRGERAEADMKRTGMGKAGTARRKAEHHADSRNIWQSRHLLLINRSGCSAVSMQRCSKPTTTKRLQAGFQASATLRG